MEELINGRTPEEIKAAVLCTERGTIPDCENCPYCGVVDEQGFRSFACYQAEFDLIAYVERLEAKQPKWISVKDRLPNEKDASEEGLILCVLADKAGNPTSERRAWHWENIVDMADCFTHWMPLPEPPKEEKYETTD